MVLELDEDGSYWAPVDLVAFLTLLLILDEDQPLEPLELIDWAGGVIAVSDPDGVLLLILWLSIFAEDELLDKHRCIRLCVCSTNSQYPTANIAIIIFLLGKNHECVEK
jgi:hypothetical protein